MYMYTNGSFHFAYVLLTVLVAGLLVRCTPSAQPSHAIVLSEAEALLQAEQYVAAESTMVASTVLTAPTAEALELMGRIHLAQFEEDKAAAYYEQAVERNPVLRAAWLGLLQAYQRTASIDAARTAFAQAQAHLADDPRLLYEAGQIEMIAGLPSQAVPLFQQALAQDTNLEEAYYALGLALRQIGQAAAADSLLAVFEARSSSSNSLDLAQRIVDLNPTVADAHYNLARAYERAEQPEAALQAYRQALILNPAFPEAHNNMGIIYFRQDQTLPAIRAFQQAIALADTAAKYHFNLGMAYARQGFVDRAEASWHHTLTLDPNYTRARTYLDALAAARDSAAAQ